MMVEGTFFAEILLSTNILRKIRSLPTYVQCGIAHNEIFEKTLPVNGTFI